MAETLAEFYGIDLKRLVADAEAAGFNPLTIIRNGGLPAYMIGMPAPGPAYAPDELIEYGGGELDFRGGGGGGGSDMFSYMYYDDWNPAEARRGAQAQRLAYSAVTAVTGYHQQMVEVVRSAGGATIAAPSTGSVSAPRVRTSPPAEAAPKVKEGFQLSQIWDKDKQPPVIMDSTFHYILPGVTWEEQGGTTRVEMFETGYGEDAPGTGLLGLPKFMNDLGHNWLRMGGAMNRSLFGHDNIPAAIAATAKRVAGEIAAQPTYKDQYGRTTFQEPSDIGTGGSGQTWQGTSSLRPTPSYSAAKEAAKSAPAAAQQAAASASKTASKQQSAKEDSKASQTKSESKSSSSSSSKKK